MERRGMRNASRLDRLFLQGVKEEEEEEEEGCAALL